MASETHDTELPELDEMVGVMRATIDAADAVEIDMDDDQYASVITTPEWEAWRVAFRAQRALIARIDSCLTPEPSA